MLRFYSKGGLGSALLRGVQVAQHLQKHGVDAEYTDNIDDLRDCTIVVIKTGDVEKLEKAKERGCRIVYDLVDKLARKIFPTELDEVRVADHLIHCSAYSGKWWSRYFDQPYSVIPHHWDVRLKREHVEGLRIGYIGASFNALYLDIFPDIIPIYNTHAWQTWAPRFNLHYNIRNWDDALFKPETKIATAAGAGANIITLKTPGALELLDEDYPYFVDKPDPELVFEALRKAHKLEGWEKGLKMMAEVRVKTALNWRDYESLHRV